jgi:arylsulfatase
MVMYGVFEGLDIGLDRRGPACWELYERHGSFPYSGEIEEVVVTPGTRAPKPG